MTTQPTHAFCEHCQGIEPVLIEECKDYRDEHYLSGDVVCKRCNVVLLTLFVVNEQVMG